eukprot:Skav222232  [mRNA]  locus=scaffold3339:48679:50427:+ [translate_table: standard]
MEASVLWFCIVTLQAGFTLKVMFLVVSFLHSHKWSVHSMLAMAAGDGKDYRTQFLKWWKPTAPSNSRSERELDRMRCSRIRILWPVVLVGTMLRLITRQVSLSSGEQGDNEFDYLCVVMASFALVLTSFPGLINPRCQDVWYVVSMLTADVSVLISASEEYRLDILIAFSLPARFMFAVLAKQTPCVVFCVLLHLVQALAIARLKVVIDTAYSVRALVGLFVFMFVGIIGVRRLLQENAFLKVDLQERTVELGAVSSLLSVCYDAVLEVDHDLRLTHDSRQLSAMLLSAPKPGGLSGEAFLDFFTEKDRLRISEQVLSSKRSDTGNLASTSVVALNADMLDSDRSHVKVELFCAQFRNLADEKCFLVGLREIQDTEASAGAVAETSSLPSDDALMVVFDMYHFDVYSMSGKMQELCHQGLGGFPDTILEIASGPSQLTFGQQLQTSGNTFAYQHEAAASTVTFNFLGLWEAEGFVTFEYDQVLEARVGSMVVVKRSLPSTLTESNLRNLDGSRGIQSPQTLGFATLAMGQSTSRSHRSRSRSGSSRSSRRFHRSPASPRCTERGAISELHELHEHPNSKVWL